MLFFVCKRLNLYNDFIFLCTSTKKSSVTKWQTTGRKALLLSQTELLKSINAKGMTFYFTLNSISRNFYI